MIGAFSGHLVKLQHSKLLSAKSEVSASRSGSCSFGWA